MNPSRRSFLTHAAAAGSSLVLARPTATRSTVASGLKNGKPVPLGFENLPGFLSKKQLTWHHDSHYSGALAGFVRLDADLAGRHRERVAKANSVLLHELYFGNMTAKKVSPGPGTGAALKRRFGSVERWLEDFRAAAKSSRGWSVLVWHPVNGKLYNVASDSHDDGPMLSGKPIAVVDTYEHAYYLDYQNRKGDYVDAFLDHLDWAALEARLRQTR